MNDIGDKKKDSFHPVKQKRPIASGALGESTATVFSAVLIITSLVLSFTLKPELSGIILAYVVLHAFYTFRFKHEVILDVIIIALGFELRIWGGCVVVYILPSVWLQLCVFLLALFLGFIKRRNEKILLYGDATKHRDVLSHYKVYFLDQMAIISATLCIVFYGMYAVSKEVIVRVGTNKMAYTIPFVVYGIFRYLYVVHAKRSGGDPGEILLTDLPLVVDISLWISVTILLLYYPFK